MTNEIIHSILLIATIAVAFVFPKTNLASYDLEVGALLFIILFVGKRFLLPRSSQARLLESIIFTFIVLMVINTTGGIESSFFFLLYFLLFSLSLLLEPIISLTATITLVIFFLANLPANQGFKQIIPIISLAFLTPFAMFMGQEYTENKKSVKKFQKSKEEMFLFLSLMLKNHIKNIKEAVENFIGDHQLHEIKASAQKMEKLIEDFENTR